MSGSARASVRASLGQDDLVSLGSTVRQRLGPLQPVAADLYRAAFINLADLATTLASLQAGPRVLEVGCGEGALASHLARAIPSMQYLGIDPSPDAGRLYDGDPERAAFRSQRVEDLVASAPEPFDLAVVVDVLHHVPSPQQRSLLAATATLVRPGGLVAVKDWEAGRAPGTWAALLADRYITGDRHVRFHDLDSLRLLIADAVPGSELVLEARIPPRRGNVLFVRRKA